jgi:hypothetical protein
MVHPPKPGTSSPVHSALPLQPHSHSLIKPEVRTLDAKNNTNHTAKPNPSFEVAGGVKPEVKVEKPSMGVIKPEVKPGVRSEVIDVVKGEVKTERKSPGTNSSGGSDVFCGTSRSSVSSRGASVTDAIDLTQDDEDDDGMVVSGLLGLISSFP